MRRRILALLFLTSIFLCLTASGFAQQLDARGGGREQAPQPAPLFFKETWKNAPGNMERAVCVILRTHAKP